MKLEDYSEYYIQGSDHYLIPRDEFLELLEERQDLINYLKDKIKMYNEIIENLQLLIEIEDMNTKKDLHIAKIMKKIYKEILSKMEGNDK